MTRQTTPRVLIMAGGTGGHVFPALAVAQELIEHGMRVAWLGSRHGIEARLVPEHDLTLHTIDVAGLRGKRLTTMLAAPVAIARALWQARQVLKNVRPSLVIGMGGFAAGPGGLMAKAMGVPLLIHEQNAAAGLTNRVLARVAATVLQAFPNTFDRARGAETVGNPVRRDILDLAIPADRFAEREGPIRLLVLGGSGGALAINERVAPSLARISVGARPVVWHQAGRTLDAATRAYKEHDVDAHIEAFIDDMASAYAWADIVICRAGALTVAELAAAGVGAILIPYPYAVDDHQRRNGEYLVGAGAARLIDQSELTPERLVSELSEFGSDRETLLTRANAARSASWPDSTRRIVDACRPFLGARS